MLPCSIGQEPSGLAGILSSHRPNSAFLYGCEARSQLSESEPFIYMLTNFANRFIHTEISYQR